MRYFVKEMYQTLQGEGALVGRAAVFIRFTGCNLWSGREKDRSSAACQFCDTDFVGTDGLGGGRFGDAAELADAAVKAWAAGGAPASACLPMTVEAMAGTLREETPQGCVQAMVVCTGGEPLLQLDEELVKALHQRGFFVAVETNGTRRPPPGIDWLTVSPKAGAELLVRTGQELKLVFPQAALMPDDLPGDLRFEHLFIQPMDGPRREQNTREAITFCRRNPRWRLSVQTHKMLGIR